jgi:hypothetical protein
MNKTLVVDIGELYSIIPEAKALEGVNFKDVRELLKNLIGAIEQSGEWQFIQHVSNKPSLIIIRKNEDSMVDLKFSMNKVNALLKKSEVAYKKLKEKIPQYESSLIIPDETYSNEEFDETSVEVKELDDFVPSTKLPWEK